MSGTKATPHCKKCDQAHFNFSPCLPRQDQKPPVEWRPSNDWGNQMTDLKVLGDNTFVQRREFDR